MVNKLAVDEKGALLATASDDKTLRLWNLPDGSPYATLRVPIGEGKKGELYAVALAPDGKTVVVGGETGDIAIDGNTGKKTGNFSLYFFDVEKRVLKARIAGLPAPILHLAYSKDGKRIAAALSGGFGVKLWDAASGDLLAEDNNYQEQSTWLDFDRKGNLATVSYDGAIRVYDPSLKLARQAIPRPKAHPYSIAYSNSGNLLAIGYADQPAVDILNANDLKLTKALKTQGLAGKNAAVAAWRSSSDGESVMAGGDLKNSQGQYVIRVWSDLIGATPTSTDIAVAENIITDLAALQSERADILFASADPAWGGVKNASLAYKNQARLWDARVAEMDNKSLRLSADGLIVEYPADLASNRSLSFDMDKMKLAAHESGSRKELALPVTALKAYKITNWRRNQPSFNGRALAMEKHEISYALAIDPASGNFLLGTEYKLRLYDDKGKEIKSIVLPAPAYGVNLSGNGKLAVAALGDGTLRWYSLGNGEVLEELAALFAYKEGKEWIAWTKEGFFGNSDGGGDSLAGYHIDKGAGKRPEWLGFSQVYQAYYAPELLVHKLLREEAPLQAKLASLDQATERLNKLPVPLIELNDYCAIPANAGKTRDFARVSANPRPPNAAPLPSGETACQTIAGQGLTRGFERSKTQPSSSAIYRNQLAKHTDQVKLRYKVMVREGGLGNVDVYVNGKIQHSQTPQASEKATLNLESAILLSPGENQILVQAYEKTGGLAEKSILVNLLNPSGDDPGNAPAPKLIVASVGINHYDPPNALVFAAKDAKDFISAIQKSKSDAYSEVKPYGLFDEQATASNIDQVFTRIQETAGPDDAVLIYLSGHGLLDDSKYYFIPYKGDADNLQATALSQQRMAENIAKLANIRKIFVFLDSCHSGAFNPEDISSFDKLKQKLGNSVYILAASQKDEEALDEVRVDGASKENGLFAYAVLEGLNGSAARRGGKAVNNYDLGLYVQQRIDELSQQVKHKQKARFQNVQDSSDIETFEITKVVN
jgi:WD40 repeat protein